uniref:Polyadenylate-binding protein n=2 Tax=Lotharella globosa TaxID=91324 RepID=A0A6V3K5C4_9EUKA
MPAVAAEEANTSRSLWVGELGFDTEEASLVNLFQTIGALESVRICRDGKTKRSLGYAYVNFQKAEDAHRAAEELNFRKINGKPCRIMLQLRDPKKRQNLRCEQSNVVIKNLPRGRIEARGLYEWLVQVAGNRITSCKIGTDRNTGAALGYAFAQFASASEAKSAIERINEAAIDSGNGRTVSAELYKAEKAVSTIYVRGLPGWWSREDIAAFFQDRFGDVDSVRVPPSCAGSCFVRFVEARDADSAIRALHNSVVFGRKLVVERAMTGLERRRRLLEGRKQRARRGDSPSPSTNNGRRNRRGSDRLPRRKRNNHRTPSGQNYPSVGAPVTGHGMWSWPANGPPPGSGPVSGPMANANVLPQHSAQAHFGYPREMWGPPSKSEKGGHGQDVKLRMAQYHRRGDSMPITHTKQFVRPRGKHIPAHNGRAKEIRKPSTMSFPSAYQLGAAQKEWKKSIAGESPEKRYPEPAPSNVVPPQALFMEGWDMPMKSGTEKTPPQEVPNDVNALLRKTEKLSLNENGQLERRSPVKQDTFARDAGSKVVSKDSKKNLSTQNEFGEMLYERVAVLDEQNAPKITGMLLELNPDELKELTSSDKNLHDAVEQAQKVLLKASPGQPGRARVHNRSQSTVQW